ncbi:hypothetical protein [Maricaulis sp.]|uniref:hypothetical protein n=1 Tax=Maricaulis sp. TaxID=1486257 RepID=UPI0026225D0A|nr:hypothetical protein [Maricaulis sp.]
MHTSPAARPQGLARFVFAIPVLGWMLRELARDPGRALLPFLGNIALVLALLTWIFGAVVIMAAALAMAPAILVTIMLMSADFGRSL